MLLAIVVAFKAVRGHQLLKVMLLLLQANQS